MKSPAIIKRSSISNSLYRLIYCSRNVIAQAFAGTLGPEGTKSEVDAILAAARRHNSANGITGALLFTTSGFAQALEGPRDTVECTFERIGCDPRHADVKVLSFTPIERRSFADWSMGFCGQTSPDVADPLAHLLADASFASQRVTTGSDVLRMLEKIVGREDEWIAA
jgi:hypothetical protein